MCSFLIRPSSKTSESNTILRHPIPPTPTAETTNNGNYSNNYSNNNGNHNGNHNGNYNNSNNGNYHNNGNHNNHSGNRNYGNRNNWNTDNQHSKFDPTQYCHFHGNPGHFTESCRAKLKDDNYTKFQQNQSSSSQTQQSQQQDPSHHRANRVCDIKALKTSTGTDVWVYDSCCTNDMTGDETNFHDFEEFPNPVPVYGVGKAVIHAIGKGKILLESTIDKSTHTLPQVWYVPGIQESIISAFNTRFNNLKTSMDDNENFVISSKAPGSSFSATTTYTNKMAVLTTVKTVKPTNKVLATTTDNANSSDSSNPPTDNQNQTSPESNSSSSTPP